jgi:hypothetical protein
LALKEDFWRMQSRQKGVISGLLLQGCGQSLCQDWHGMRVKPGNIDPAVTDHIHAIVCAHGFNHFRRDPKAREHTAMPCYEIETVRICPLAQFIGQLLT